MRDRRNRVAKLLAAMRRALVGYGERAVARELVAWRTHTAFDPGRRRRSGLRHRIQRGRERCTKSRPCGRTP